MPVVSRFFGIVIRMFFDEHNPPHFHAEYQERKACFDFQGNIFKGDLKSRTAIRFVRDWIDLHVQELEDNWNFARSGEAIHTIDPLQ